MSQKMQDPRSFIVPCTIGNHEFGKALCDSGASINLMPLLVLKRLSLGELTPTTLSVRPKKFQFLEKGQNRKFDYKIVISVKNP